jgi:hypothetical protein
MGIHGNFQKLWEEALFEAYRDWEAYQEYGNMTGRV